MESHNLQDRFLPKKYHGSAAGRLIQIKVYDTYLILCNIIFYQEQENKLQICRRFTIGGRIDILKFSLGDYEKNNYVMDYEVLKVIDFIDSRLNPNWLEQRVELGPIPKEAVFLSRNKDFFSESIHKQYLRLIRFSHSLMNHINNAVESNSLYPPRKLILEMENNKFTLPEIRNNVFALGIIEKAAGIYPLLSIIEDRGEKHIGVLSYRKFYNAKNMI